MKIAVTYDNGQVFQHFGHTENFKIYEATERKVLNAQIVSTAGSGHGALAGFLKEHQVDVLICGGIGGGAVQALNGAGIQLFAGVSGSADAAVIAYLNHELDASAQPNCNHHGEHHDGNCSGHSCGHTC